MATPLAEGLAKRTTACVRNPCPQLERRALAPRVVRGGGNGCTGDKFGVEPPELSEMIARVIRDEAFESRAREPPAEPSRAEEGYTESTEPR